MKPIGIVLGELIRRYLTPRVIVGSISLGVILVGMTALTIWVLKPPKSDIPTATPILQVVLLPTVTPTVITPTPVQELTPTLSNLPSPPPGVIAIGAYVQVSGTGGDGLRLRSTPGLDGEVLLLGYEAEVFQVIDGPQPADGYTWWYLVAPYDEKVQGWAVANFLAVVPNP